MSDDRHRPAIEERDLLAYADGLIDGDVVRRHAVEAYLRAHPEEDARIRAYIDQNRAIRARFGPALARPVPDRLARLVMAPPGGRWRAVAASLALAAAAGTAGWLLAAGLNPQSAVQRAVENAVVARARDGHTAAGAPPEAAMPVAGAFAAGGAREIALGFELPDLSARGFAFVDRHLVAVDGDNGLLARYEDREGRPLYLLVGVRAAPPGGARIVDRDGLAVASWVDGPFVYGLAAPLPPAQLADIKQNLRPRARWQGDGMMAILDDGATVGEAPTLKGTPAAAPEPGLDALPASPAGARLN